MNAEIVCLWIAEKKPDLFSDLIMWFLDCPYSHNAILNRHTGMLWHSHSPGVTEEPPMIALKGCKVVARLGLTLNCSTDMLAGYLEGERGKEYGNVQIAGFVVPFMQKLVGNGNGKRVCSEFMGQIVHKFYKPIPGDPDYWTPKYLEKVLKPQRL